MQNCNCSPAAMMREGQPSRDRFRDRLYLYNESPSRASHQRSEMVSELLAAADNVTLEQAIEIAFSTQVWRAETWQARIERAWQKAPEADRQGDPGRIYEMIRSWNRRLDAGSRRALAFYEFKKALGSVAAASAEPPANLSDQAILRALSGAAVALMVRFGELDVPYGRYFRVGRRGGVRTWPVGGGSHENLGMATPRAVSFAPSPDGKQMIGHAGQSSTQVVVLTDPPESYAVIPLGESDRRESGHWDDQAERLFSKSQTVRTYFLRPDELKKHVTATKVLDPAAPR
jgi:acyl-homoserine lactone acylase PvdQ